MSVPMKKHPIERVEPILIRGKRFYVPPEKASAVLILLKGDSVQAQDEEMIPADEVFKDLHAKYTKHGSALRGARFKEEMTQVELASKLKITQSDLSKMEHGKRPIGKKMAKRLAKVLNINYRVFL